MADQTSPLPAKPIHATNGAAKPTPQGRVKPVALPKRGPTKHPRNTAISPDVIKRLQQLVKGGDTIKTAAEALKIGYSTAQWYLRSLRGRSEAAAPKKKAKRTKTPKGYRLSPKQVEVIQRLLPRMPDISAAEIAKEAGCHLSSVYQYRRQMLNESGGVADAPEQPMTTALYADLRDINRRIWNDCWDKRVELSDGEIRAIILWRRTNSQAR